MLKSCFWGSTPFFRLFVFHEFGSIISCPNLSRCLCNAKLCAQCAATISLRPSFCAGGTESNKSQFFFQFSAVMHGEREHNRSGKLTLRYNTILGASQLLISMRLWPYSAEHSHTYIGLSLFYAVWYAYTHKKRLKVRETHFTLLCESWIV